MKLDLTHVHGVARLNMVESTITTHVSDIFHLGSLDIAVTSANGL
jgi:hypothetical protein